MTLFDDRGAKPGKVESIVFNERQATRRSRTSWIPAARPAAQVDVAVPKIAPLPPLPTVAEEPTQPSTESEAQAPARVAAAPPPPPSAPIADPALTARAEAARIRAEQAAEAFEQATLELTKVRPQILAETERELVELALAIARRVLQREFDAKPSLVIELAKQGIAALAESDRILVRVGASLDDSITSSLAQTMARKGAAFEILRDDHLPPFGCVVETEFGRVDESLDSRFAHVESTLLAQKART